MFEPARLTRPMRVARIGLAVLLLAGPAAFYAVHSAGHEDACDAIQGRYHRGLELFGKAQWDVVRELAVQGRLLSLRFAPVEGCVWADADPVQPGDIAWMERVHLDRPEEEPRVFAWKAITNNGTFLASYPLLPGTAFRVCLRPWDAAEGSEECTDYFGRPAGWTYTNLLRNSGFEDQVAGQPPAPPWETRGSAEFEVESGGFRGANVLRVEFDDGPAAEPWNEIRQAVHAEAGRSYVLRAFVAPGGGVHRGCVGVRDARTGELRAAFVFGVDDENIDSFRKVAVQVTAEQAVDLEVFVGASSPGQGFGIRIDQITFSPDPLDAWERREISAMEYSLDLPSPADQAPYCGG